MTLPETSEDDRFLIASTINLYIESLRRTSGRVLLAPDDITTLFDMIRVMTDHKPVRAFTTSVQRTRQLTEEEREKVLMAFPQEEEV